MIERMTPEEAMKRFKFRVGMRVRYVEPGIGLFLTDIDARLKGAVGVVMGVDGRALEVEFPGGVELAGRYAWRFRPVDEEEEDPFGD